MCDIEGWGSKDAPNDGYASEGELDTRALVAQHNIKKKKSKSGGFQVMGLSHPVLKGILKKGYKVPTPIQRKTIPHLLEGKDVVAMARTGSGKTAAFLIPIFERLRTHSAATGARALVLSPTRELALQTLKFTKELGRFTGLRAAVILGGDSIEGQFEVMHSNPDIIIATPGRFVHLCVEMEMKLNHIEYIVFDEADRLFEMGFAEQMRDILGRVPEMRQTLLFSATLPKLLVDFAKAGLTDPVLIRLDVETKLSDNLKMAFIKCNTDDKLAALMFILRNVIKEKEQSIIFAATKHHVEYIHLFLTLVGIENTYIYSSLDQTARKLNVTKFQTKKIRCLVVTDVAARGIDIPLLDNVINFNFPAKEKLFIHRVGRVARAGRCGTAFSLVAPDEAPHLLDLYLFLSESIKFAPTNINTNELDWDKMYGAMPQTIIDNEADQLQSVHRDNYDLQVLKKGSENGYKHYIKSRPLPSSESVRKMKEESWDRTLGNHPIFIKYLISGDNSYEVEEKRQSLLNTLKMLRPKTTIFEINQSRKVKLEGNMQTKRMRDQKFIDKFYNKIEDRKAEKELKNSSLKENAETKTDLQLCSENEIENVFQNPNTGIKRKLEDTDNNTKKKLKKNKNNANIKKQNSEDKVSSKKDKGVTSYKNDEYYIPYASKDRYSEQGYSIGSSFERETANAELDLADDANKHLQIKPKMRWHRKRMCYVGEDTGKKKILTESGAWIPASYKTDRYKKWVEKCKNKVDNDSDGEDNSYVGRRRMKTLRGSSTSKKHPLLRGKEDKSATDKKPPKRELKTQDEIRKARKVAYQNKLKNRKGGMKRRKNKNRR